MPSSGRSGRNRYDLDVMSRLNSVPSALSLARPTWHQGQMGSPQTNTGIAGFSYELTARIIGASECSLDRRIDAHEGHD